MNLTGEIFALSKEFAAASRKIKDSEVRDCMCQMTELKREFYKKYAGYLYEFDKEKLINLAVDALMEISRDDVSLIYRPPWNTVGQTFAIKFKRSQNDNLKEVD